MKRYKINRCRVVIAGCFFSGIVIQGTPVFSDTAGNYSGVFRELPVSSIHPERWMKETLERQRDGLMLNRYACGYPFASDLWVGKLPKKNWEGYEQTAYFVDGLYRTGLLLNDPVLQKIGLDNIKYTLNHPDPNGHLGPTQDDVTEISGPDGVAGPSYCSVAWPFVVFTRALMAYYDATGDQQVIEALKNNYLTLDNSFGAKEREVNTIEGLCWLYSKTGDVRFRDKAEQVWQVFINEGSANKGGFWLLDNLKQEKRIRGHGVSVSELIKQVAILYLATGKKEYLDAATGGFRSLYRDHELVDGVISSDAGPAGKEPDHQHETCVITDYPWSLGYMLMASGDVRWADSIERAAYNAAYSVFTKDFKAFQYYAAPNQITATQKCNHPKASGESHRPLQAYRPDHSPACCTGNAQRMFPTFFGRMWMTDGAGGLAAVFYGPCAVTARAGAEGVPVTIEQETDYPFEGTVNLKIIAEKSVKFPLYLRIPGWAEGATVEMNGKSIPEAVHPGTFLKLERTFTSGSVVQLKFPMKVRKEEPVEEGVALVRGPLVYSLLIVENEAKAGRTMAGNPDFPSWDVTPGSSWNYGLVLKTADDVNAVQVNVRPLSGFPWTPENTPVVLTAKARKIPGWDLIEPYGETPELPERSLIAAEEKTETVELIPYGATLLRLSVFPEVSDVPVGSLRMLPKIKSYSSSISFAAGHKDTAIPSRLIDGRWNNAGQSVQFDSDVVITAELEKPTRLTKAGICIYQVAKGLADSFSVETSKDGITWEAAGSCAITNAAQPSGSPACEIMLPIDREASYVRFFVKKTPESSRLLLGEIIIQ